MEAAAVNAGKSGKGLDGVRLFWEVPDCCRNVFRGGWVSGGQLQTLEVKVVEELFVELKNLLSRLPQI